MAAYTTLDYLTDLTPAARAAAGTLTFKRADANSVGWDNSAEVYGLDRNALLHDTYRFTAIEGASYTIASTSYFDPYLLRVYDQYGNVIVANDEADDMSDVRLSDQGWYSLDNIWSWKAPYSGTFYVGASWNQGSYYTFYSLIIHEDVDTATGRTSTTPSLGGSAGNDLFVNAPAAETFNGGNGIDTVEYAGFRSKYSVQISTDAVHVSSSTYYPGASDSLVSIERLKFQDGMLALDFAGTPGQAYRLYQAAFDRKPDASGLGYHISAMDRGASLQDIAQGFLNSPEFLDAYGGLNDSQFITRLYRNVLDRDPDAAGLSYQLNALASGTNRAQMLVNFSESPENQVALLGSISGGVFYTL